MSNKKKGKIVKEEKDNKQEEEILKLEIENSEEIDEKEFEKAKRKYEERMKLPFGVKKGIYVKILKELIIPVVMVVLFTLTYILKEVLNFITINVFVIIYGIEKKKYIQKFIDTKDIVKDSRKKYIV